MSEASKPDRARWHLVAAGCLSLSLCARVAALAQTQSSPTDNRNAAVAPGEPTPKSIQAGSNGTPSAAPLGTDVQVLPIDLPTALRLVNAANPTIALARERVREAYARQRQAEVLWLPNLETGPAYMRHDGRLQNSAGLVFPVSKSNFFMGGGAAMRFETADALFEPLIARRLTDAQAAAARAVTDNVQLDVALTYLDLLRVYGAIGINADSLARAEAMLKRAEAASETQLSRSTADVTRARTEYNLRQEERIDLEGQAATVSARLAQLLLLQPTVDLQPADPAVVPIALVPAGIPLDELVATGLMNRPELAESRSLVAAALARWRQARVSPFVPRVEVTYYAGTFGGGTHDEMDNFGSRGDGTAQAVWELRNLGVGDVARARERRALYNEANFHVMEVQAQVGAEVAAAAKLSRSRERALVNAQAAVREAAETWRRLDAASFGLANPREKLLNTLEPLIAIQTLSQARLQYLTQVIEYDKAQFRLYTAMGQPPLEALAEAVSLPVDVPAVPPKYQPTVTPAKP